MQLLRLLNHFNDDLPAFTTCSRYEGWWDEDNVPVFPAIQGGEADTMQRIEACIIRT